MELLSRGNRDQKGLRVWCVLQMFLSSGTPGIARVHAGHTAYSGLRGFS